MCKIASRVCHHSNSHVMFIDNQIRTKSPLRPQVDSTHTKLLSITPKGDPAKISAGWRPPTT